MQRTRRIRLSGDRDAVKWLTARLADVDPDARLLTSGASAADGADEASVEVEVSGADLVDERAPRRPDRSQDRTDILASIAAAARDTLDVGTILEKAIQILGARLGVRSVDLWLLDSERAGFELSFQWRGSQEVPPLVGHVELLTENETFAELCRTLEPFTLTGGSGPYPTGREDGTPGASGSASVAGVPIHREGEMLGLLGVTWNEPRTLHPEEMLFLSRVADQLALTIRASRLYRNLRKQMAALEAARQEKEEASLGTQRMSAMVVHDLKNPLSAIMASLELFKERAGGEIDPRARRMLQNATASARGLQGLVEDLLLFYRPPDAPKDDLSPVSPSEILALQFEEGRWMAEARRIQLEVDIPSGIPRVKVDPAGYRRAVANLLGNALKFTPPGGRVTASMSIETHGEAADLVFSVADTGPGLEESDRLKLATPYLRFSNAEGIPGHGIGLTVVRMVAERHQGRLEVLPNGARGSIFRLIVPA